MSAIWNSFKISFAMYSKIPMPQSEWTKENMRYVMCFLPVIGGVIGGLFYGWMCLADFLGISGGSTNLFYVAVLVLIPVTVTGGIHLDGFLDTSDALSSWQTKERRLEILKDSRAGAFAVIMGCCYFVLSFGAYGSLGQGTGFLMVCMSFVLTRAFSGLAIVKFRMAKNTGLAATFADGAQKRTVGIWMIIYILVVSTVMILVGRIHGVLAVASVAAVFFWYRRMAYKDFGGITGDLAGWYVQVSELAVAVVMVLAGG